MTTLHPMTQQADALKRKLFLMACEADEDGNYIRRNKLERIYEKASTRVRRRYRAYDWRPLSRRGKVDTKDRPYAVGGRGKRGW